MGNILLLFNDRKDKIMEIKYPFEQIENILYRQAHLLHKKFPNKYEIDELVNEVWVKGSIQKVNNIKYIAARAYWDMLDYIRVGMGRKICKNKVEKDRPKFITNMHDHGFYSNDLIDDFFADKEDYRNNDINFVDYKDELDYILTSLPEQEREILSMYYLEELTLKEMGEKLNLLSPKISTWKKQIEQKVIKLFYVENTLKELGKEDKSIRFDCHSIGYSKRLHKSELDKKEAKLSRVTKEEEKIREIMEHVLPEYVVDYEIDNTCAVDEDLHAFISEIDQGQDALYE